LLDSRDGAEYVRSGHGFPGATPVKLIRQVRLEFRQGTSDKVYEVDLCEVGAGRYVVNFRYGRRGTALRDGSKTPAPVPRAKAEAVFERLVASKRGEGYVDFGTAAVPAPARPASRRPAAPPPAAAPPRAGPGRTPGRGGATAGAATPAATGAASAQAGHGSGAGGGPGAGEREQGVLRRLREGFGRKSSGDYEWRLSRAIWRAGELGLRSAEPLLLDLLAQTRQMKAQRGRSRKSYDRDAVADLLGPRTPQLPRWRWRPVEWSEDFAPPEDLILYSLAWSLGRCGSAASVPALEELVNEPWAPIVRIAIASLLLLPDRPGRADLIEELTGRLPDPLGGLYRGGPADAFRQALQEHLARADAQPTPVLDCLYLIDREPARPALLDLLRTVPVQSAYFQSFRHIFKIAELRRDAEAFGVLAHRFETAPLGAAAFRPKAPVMRYKDDKLTRATASLSPFGRDSTRRYLRLRAWRTLRRLGEAGDLDYVRMAEGVLLPFTDADGRGPTEFGRYWAFSQILYRNCPHFVVNPRAGVFIRKRPGRPRGETALFPGAERWEAFPELWEAAPEALLRLLGGSRCEAVHRFAVRVLRDCPDFCRRLDVPALARLLAAPYEATTTLGLDLAVQRYDPAAPQADLALALADSTLARARAQAREWVEAQRNHFTQDLAFLAALAGSPQAETRAFARDLLRQTAFPPAAAEELVARVVSLLRSFTADEGERAGDTAQTLQVAFAVPLRAIGVDVIRDLLDHPLAEVRRFAGELVLTHDVLSRRPPEDLLLRLLQDADASVRGVGVRLLGHLPDETLTQSLDLLVGLSRHELADFRANVRPLVKRLADADPDFGRRFAERLVEALLVSGAPEGVPSHTARVLREDLRAYLDRVPPAVVWKLLQARSPVAQEVGGMLLATNVRPEDLGLDEVVKLASHDIQSVREASWRMCQASLGRLKADMDAAARLLDAKWDDSRQFAFGLLRDAFGRGELTPAVLVSLCDSVRPDVQQFGREMITRLFEESDGPEYAIKLSEHPSPSMQMFAANFLERYAGDSPARLRELSFYFQSVLSRVNQGRVAKDRVFAFLAKSAQTGEENARFVAEVLGRQSATASVQDRARAVAILTEIRAAHPSAGAPLRIKPVEVRNGV
jgi:hypothetical protein